MRFWNAPPPPGPLNHSLITTAINPTAITVWISNYTLYLCVDGITYPCPDPNVGLAILC